MKSILVASDLSLRSEIVLARAIGLAAAHGAEIRIVHAPSEAEPENAGTQTCARMRGEAAAMADVLTDLPLKISARVRSERPAELILAEAEAWHADLILLGSHGEPNFRDVFFGTTGTHVVRHAGCPVLVVQNEAIRPYSRVLIAVDEVLDARPILDAARDVAPASELFAIHAFYPSLRQTLAGQAALDKAEERRERELQNLLSEVAEGQPQEPQLTAQKHAVVETGEALSVIMQETEKLAPDLLVMGTRRRATYLGSHAVDTLFWCPHDVLVVPERQSETLASPVQA